MTLQSDKLTMIGLGIDDHTQSDGRFPDLIDGNHLRWSVAPNIGFPPHGYYLFRRKHIGDVTEPRSLHEIIELDENDSPLALPHSIQGNFVKVTFGGPETLPLRDWWGLTMFDLRNRNPPLRIEFSVPMFEIIVSVFVENEEPNIKAYSDGVEVDAATADATGTHTVSADRIDAIELENLEVLASVDWHPVVGEHSFQGWEPVPGIELPIALPLTHGDYPAGRNAWGRSQQNLRAAREIATSRIEYGPPEHYTSQPTDVTTGGTVTVTKDSPIVEGNGTDWTRDEAGGVFHVTGDETAYVVIDVLPNETGDRLILSRPYEGTTGGEYAIRHDRFGQLHDYLIALISARGDGGMAGCALPLPVTESGTAKITGEATVVGDGTNWSEAHEGLQLRMGTSGKDTVAVTSGERTVRRKSGTQWQWGTLQWDDRIVGNTIRFDDNQNRYTIADARDSALILDRPFAGYDNTSVSYTVYERPTYTIESVDSTAQEITLATPYRASLPTGTSNQRPYEITAQFADSSGEASGVRPTMSYQYPLDLIQMASVNPAIAQALGLYHIDQDASVDQSYDYLLIADYNGSVEQYGAPSEYTEIIQPWLFAQLQRRQPEQFYTAAPSYTGAVTGLQGYITFDVQRGEANPLSSPSNPEVYELPEVRNNPGPNAAGLTWDLPMVSTEDGIDRMPEAPVLYHLWRHKYDADDGPPADQAPPAEEYDALTAPPGTDEENMRDLVMVGETGIRSDEGQSPSLPGWPVDDIHTTDRAVPDGWYSYRIGGVDLFGRLSEPSPAATWWAGDPETETAPEHDVAIRLEDSRPPPPPRRVDARLIETDDGAGNNGDDGDDERDTAVVTWRWPQQFVEQAPDAAGFYIHYRPGRLHDQVGTVTDVVDNGDGQYTVRTDITPWDPSTGYAGSTLHIDDAAYEVTTSRSRGSNNSQLELDVVDKRSEPTESVTTEDGTDVTIDATDSRPNVTVDDTALSLRTPSKNDSCTVSVPPAYKKGEVTVNHGEQTVYGHGTSWESHLEGQELTTPDGTGYIVNSVIDGDKLELDRQYEIPDEEKRDNPRRVSYAIAHPVRTDYSDPDAWDPPSAPANWQTTDGTVPFDAGTLTRDREEPKFADGEEYREYEVEVAVPGTGDPSSDPFVPDGTDPVAYAHFAVSTFDDDDNEGPVSGPVQITRRKEAQPSEPESPDFENEIDWATPPDYDGRSRYTVRWKHPGADLRTHVYRTMDKALFRRDWTRRTEGASQDVTPDDEALFPPYRRGSGPPATRREQIVTMLSDLHAAVSGEADFQAAFEHYRDLDPDVQQVIAALPENEKAYAQQTVEPLDPDEWTNEKGPDFEEGDPVGDEWCGWVDEFDGRSRRRYFYRTATVDEAHNRSVEMSYPSQPVQAEDVVPPTSPSPNGIEAGHHDETKKDDRAITLKWERAPERDSAKYRVYHTLDEASSRDTRLMTEVAVVPQSDSGSVVWSDTDRRSDKTHYYRITAVDEAGNESKASSVLAGKPFNLAPPEPPTIDTLAWVQVADDGTIHPDDAEPPSGETWRRVVHIEWSASDPALRSLVEVQTGPGSFREASEWLDPGEYSYLHQPKYWDGDLVYRIAVRNRVGTRNERYETATLSMGGDQ